MNLIVVTKKDFITDKQIVLSDERFVHIRNIHQSSIGKPVRIGMLDGLIGTGIIESINEQSVTLHIELNQQAPKKLPLTVILALPRPKMIRRIFRSIAELGVQELIIINSYKVEKSFWYSPALETNKVQDYLISGLTQAKDTVLPKVSFKRLFKPFVEDELPTLITNTQALLAHPGIGKPCPHALDQAITLAIGPEGGFTEYEANKLLEAGFEAIHLGQRILRVENALTALASKLYS